MLYSYNIKTEGLSSHYITIAVDKQLSQGSNYSQGILNEKATPKENDLFRAIRNTKGVLKTESEHSFPAEHIHLDGNQVTVKTFELCPQKKRKLAYLLVRKIARRYAKGEKIKKA